MAEDTNKNEHAELSEGSSSGGADNGEALGQGEVIISDANTEDVQSSDIGAQQFSVVAMTADRKKVVAVLFMLAIGVIVYFVFFHESEVSVDKDRSAYDKGIEETKAQIVKESISLPKISDAESKNVVQPVQIPEPLPVTTPIPPSPPPAPIPSTPPTPIIATERKTTPYASPPIPNVQIEGPAMSSNRDVIPIAANPFDSGEEQRKKQIAARRQAGIMVMGSGSGVGGADKNDDNAKDGESKAAGDSKKKASASGFLGFGNGALDKEVIGKSSAPQVFATKVSNLDRTILQGSIINSVLETAINTDIPGTLRAIVSRDVYAESGNSILIPKGSRLIGSYESNVKAGQTRVNIMWNRIIRPDGVDIAIDSAGTDALGRTGVTGALDDKLALQLMNAFMVSYLIPLGAQVVTGGGDNEISSSTNTGDDNNPITTVTGTSRDILLQQAAQDFSKTVSDSIKNSTSVKPTITVDQGTIVNILVQKDLIFPSSMTGAGVVIK